MGKNQSASNLTNIIKQDASGNITFVSGSTTLMSVSSSGAIATTGNVAGTASYASNAELFDGLDSTVFAITGSNTFTGIQTVNSNLIVTGSITAQTLVVQTITSSVDFVTGSTRFGSLSSNTHIITGSMYVTGAFYVASGSVGIGTTSPNDLLEVRGYVRLSAGAGSAPQFSIFSNNQTTGSVTLSQGFATATDNIGYLLNRSSADFVFGTSNAERMRITSAGNVGIGTSSPGSKLHIYDGTNPISLKIQRTSVPVYLSDIATAGTTAGSSWSHNMENISNGSFNWGSFSNTGYAGSAILLNANTATSFITFYTAASANTNPTEKMRIAGGGTISIASGGNVEIDNGYLSTSAGSGTAYCSKLFTSYAYPYIDTYLDSQAGPSYEGRIIFRTNTGNGAFGNRMIIYNSGAVVIQGALSKGSGSFRIKHPLASKKNTHQLVHSFIEGPQADLIYSGGVTLVDGKAIINIDEAATMTEGTFEALNRNIRVFTSNETSWDNVRGKVVGNILTIECQNTESTDEISWMVIGERQDEHIMDTEWTDENGKVIVEPLIPEEITTI
jgi:hypothetical protein